MKAGQAPHEIVRAGYDAIAQRYTDWATEELTPGRRHALAKIAELVPAGASLLDLGCGAGVPMDRLLAQRWRVHGIDFSAAQIELARRNVPAATFERADMTELELAAEAYDAVVAFYSLTHLERDSLAGLLARIRRWLRPAGVLVASFGAKNSPGDVEEWLGVPMFFSGFDPETNRTLVANSGLEVVDISIVEEPEHGDVARFTWIAARKNPPGPTPQPVVTDRADPTGTARI